jgi:PAS domain S-box-containing protein
MSQTNSIPQIDLARLFDLSLDMLCIATPDGFFRHVNPAFEKVLGYSQEVLLSTPFLDFVHPDDKEATVAELGRLANGNDTIAFENRYKCADQDFKSLHWTAAPDPQSELIYASARDVTQQKADAIALRRIQRFAASSTMTAGIAHDLNNILTPIMMTVEFLKTKPAEIDDEIENKLYAQLFDAINQGRHLTDQLHELAKGDSIAFHRVDLHRVIQKAIDTIETGLAEKLKIETVVEEKLWQVSGNETQLFQVILNLLKNAQYATTAGGALSICGKNVSKEEVVSFAALKQYPASMRFVMIEIRDTGKGIPREHQEQIFSPYYSSHPEDGGTGIGLAVVTKIIADHGGSITLDSIEGVGSTFSIVLPACFE